MRRSVSRRLALMSPFALLASIAVIVSCTGDDPPFVDPTRQIEASTGSDGDVVGREDATPGADARATDDGAAADADAGPSPAKPFFLHFPQSQGSAGAGPFVRQDRSNNTYVAFSFTGSVTLGGKTLTSAGADDFAILKLSQDGTVLWANRFGGDQADVVNGLAIDRAGDGPVYVVGDFASATLQFDDKHVFANSAVTSTHPFVASFDTTDGKLVDAYDFAAPNSSGSCDSIEAAGGAVFAGCTLTGDVTMMQAGGPLNLTGNPGSSNAVFARMKPDLRVTWANVVGGQLDEAVSAVTIGSDGACYAAFSTTSSNLKDRMGFALGSVPGSKADYIFQFDPLGKVAWPFALPRTDADFVDVHALAATPHGVTFAGELGGTMAFPAASGPALTATANSTKHDVLVGALDTTGKAQWVRHYGANTNISGTFTVAVEGNRTFSAAQASTTIDVDGVTVSNPNDGQRLAFLAEIRHDQPDAQAGDAQAPFVRSLKPLVTPAGSYSTGLFVSSDFMVWSGAFNANTDFGGGQTATPTLDGGFDGFVLGFKR